MNNVLLWLIIVAWAWVVSLTGIWVVDNFITHTFLQLLVFISGMCFFLVPSLSLAAAVTQGRLKLTNMFKWFKVEFY